MAALRKVSVHAYEDPGRPEGGHAILLLHGLTKAPPELSFRLKPSDASVITDASGWPAGELRPLASRVTPEGLELQLGPEITENEFLLPGTLLEIEVANADARGEFLWPNIAPMLRPKRRTVIVNSPRRKGPGGDPAKDNAPAPDTKRGPGAEAAPAMGQAAGAATVEPHQSVAAASPEQGMSDADTKDAAPPAATGAERKPDIAHVRKPATTASTPLPPASPAGKPHVAQVSLRGAPVIETPASKAETAATGRAAADRPQATLRGALPAAEARPAPAPATASAAGTGFYPHARGGQVAERKGKATRWRGSALAQGLLGLVAAAAAFFVLSRESARVVAPQPGADPATTVAMAPPPASPANPVVSPSAPPAATPGGAAQATVFEALSAGALSPRGTSAASVSALKALEIANAQLTGATRDTDEAGFWLKRYIAQTLGNDRTTRALTQLGSVYAEPASGAPDYVKARLLWEIASAAGDPVAMCFLGLLAENGLGGSADRRAALTWYERSKQAGGCPAVDDAITRVR